MDDSTYHVDPFNALRVFAALLVFILHTYMFSDYVAPGGISVLFITPAWAGVWIFFTLSGYLAGKNFISGKYDYSKSSILKYYLTRIAKVFVPALLFIFIVCVICEPNFLHNNPEVLIQFLTSTYNGQPGFTEIGATWYVFTLMWLYLLAPFLSYLMHKIDEKIVRKKTFFYSLLFIVIACGLVYRILLCCYGNLDWYKYVYTFPFSNIDLFFSGIIINYVCKYYNPSSTNKKNMVLKITSIILIAIAFVTNCWVYSRIEISIDCFNMYRYVYPTIWLAITTIFIIGFNNTEVHNSKPTFKMVCKHPLSIIDFLSAISFEFYLWHPVIDNAICDSVSVYFNIPTTELTGHILFLITAFLITTVFAYIFNIINQHISSKLMSVVKQLT